MKGGDLKSKVGARKKLREEEKKKISKSNARNNLRLIFRTTARARQVPRGLGFGVGALSECPAWKGKETFGHMIERWKTERTRFKISTELTGHRGRKGVKQVGGASGG